mmetsp:Transcript_23885/g.57593  ORF Transcript_23885/g.57593 Transcript_23885/m.57593 type:complete len:252 (-) Transcript_23885:413-1168(-)
MLFNIPQTTAWRILSACMNIECYRYAKCAKWIHSLTLLKLIQRFSGERTEDQIFAPRQPIRNFIPLDNERARRRNLHPIVGLGGPSRGRRAFQLLLLRRQRIEVFRIVDQGKEVADPFEYIFVIIAIVIIVPPLVPSSYLARLVHDGLQILHHGFVFRSHRIQRRHVVPHPRREKYARAREDLRIPLPSAARTVEPKTQQALGLYERSLGIFYTPRRTLDAPTAVEERYFLASIFGNDERGRRFSLGADHP